MQCPGCRSSNLPGYRFCHHCGHPLDAASVTATIEAGLATQLAEAFENLERGDLAAAEVVLKDVLSEHPDSVSAHSVLATVCERYGRTEEAIAHLEIVLDRCPDSIADRERLRDLKGETTIYSAAASPRRRWAVFAAIAAGAVVLAIGLPAVLQVTGGERSTPAVNPVPRGAPPGGSVSSGGAPGFNGGPGSASFAPSGPVLPLPGPVSSMPTPPAALSAPTPPALVGRSPSGFVFSRPNGTAPSLPPVINRTQAEASSGLAAAEVVDVAPLGFGGPGSAPAEPAPAPPRPTGPPPPAQPAARTELRETETGFIRIEPVREERAQQGAQTPAVAAPAQPEPSEPPTIRIQVGEQDPAVVALADARRLELQGIAARQRGDSALAVRYLESAFRTYEQVGLRGGPLAGAARTGLESCRRALQAMRSPR